MAALQWQWLLLAAASFAGDVWLQREQSRNEMFGLPWAVFF
jgi:hypothetical protein